MKTVDIKRCSQAVAAEVLGVDARTLRRWEAAPRRGDGTYSLRELVAWRIREVEAEYMAAGADTTGQGSDGLERFRRARAELVELDLRERRGELLIAADVYSDLLIAAGAIRNRLMGLSHSLPPQLIGLAAHESIFTILDREVRAALQELSDAFGQVVPKQEAVTP